MAAWASKEYMKENYQSGNHSFFLSKVARGELTLGGANAFSLRQPDAIEPNCPMT
jgi:hypothetical protein